MARPATRIGDKDLPHCSLPIRARGSSNVFVNGRPWSRILDRNVTHLEPNGDKCTPHSAPLARGSSQVFINGRPAGAIAYPVLKCTMTAQGSSNVFIG